MTFEMRTNFSRVGFALTGRVRRDRTTVPAPLTAPESRRDF